MRMVTTVTILAALLTTPAYSQEPPKPGPEHEMLKKQVGVWDATMKAGGAEHKGTVTHTMELGGLWLVGTMEIDLGGQKLSGRSLDTYDAKKKKFVGVWADSMATTPMLMEGTFDPATKKTTMIGDGVGMDGKPAKWKSVTEMPDNDTLEMSMFVGDAKEPMFVMTYKRKK